MKDIRMLHHERLTAALARVKSGALEIVQTADPFPNIVFVIGMDFVEAIPFTFDSNEQKKFVVGLIRGFAKAHNAVGIIMASDAWVTTKKPDGKPLDVNKITPPSESPDRKQALIITATGEQFRKGFIIDYDRVEGKVVIGEETSMDDFEDFNWQSLFGPKKFDA